MPSLAPANKTEALEMAFENSPVGMCVTENRVVTICNLPIMLGGVFNMGGSAVVNCVSILEAVR